MRVASPGGRVGPAFSKEYDATAESVLQFSPTQSPEQFPDLVRPLDRGRIAGTSVVEPDSVAGLDEDKPSSVTFFQEAVGRGA